MGGRRRILVVVACVTVAAGLLRLSPEAQFLLGGAALNVGYRLQDGLHDFESRRHEDIAPEEVWRDFLRHNELASGVRARFPRSTYHPLMALLVCMDARIDTNELVGDTRRNYYIVRTAGSALSPKEEDMLELAVNNGVKVILLTRHTDCAAEKAEADPAERLRYPALVASLDERDARVQEFLARPAIAERIADGRLLVKQLVIDTANDHVLAAMPPASGSASGH
jgi:carbonic anhydrase